MNFFKKYKLELFIFLLYIFIFCLIIQNNIFTWDKGIWFEKINYMAENKLAYYGTDEWILGISEYPISFTYFLILFFPFIKILSEKSFFIIFGLIQIISIFLSYYILEKLKIDKKRRIIFLLLPLNLFLASSRFDALVLYLFFVFIYFFIEKKYFKFSLISIFTFFLKVFPIAFFISYYKTFLQKKILILYFFLITLILNFFIFFNPKTFFYPFIKLDSFRIQSLFGFLEYLGFSIQNQEVLNYSIMIILFLVALIFSKKSFGLMISLICLLLLTSKFLSPQWFIIICGILVLTKFNIYLIVLINLITFVNFSFFWSYSAFNIFELNFYTFFFIVFTIFQHLFLYYVYFYFVFKKDLIEKKSLLSKIDFEFNFIKDVLIFFKYIKNSNFKKFK